MPGNKRGNKQYGRNAAKDKSTDSKKNKKKGMARRKKAVITWTQRLCSQNNTANSNFGFMLYTFMDPIQIGSKYVGGGGVTNN